MSDMVKTFAKKSGKSEDEVAKLYKSCADKAIEDGKEKDSDDFKSYVSDALKKKLKLDDKPIEEENDSVMNRLLDIFEEDLAEKKKKKKSDDDDDDDGDGKTKKKKTMLQEQVDYLLDDD